MPNNSETKLFQILKSGTAQLVNAETIVLEVLRKIMSGVPRACPWHPLKTQASLDLNPGFSAIAHIS